MTFFEKYFEIFYIFLWVIYFLISAPYRKKRSAKPAEQAPTCKVESVGELHE